MAILAWEIEKKLKNILLIKDYLLKPQLLVFYLEYGPETIHWAFLWTRFLISKTKIKMGSGPVYVRKFPAK